MGSKAHAGGFEELADPYTMVIHIPYYEDSAGAVWLERLWYRDLVEHLSYLRDFILCAPRLPKTSEPNLVRLEPPDRVRLRFVPLPPRATYLHALLGIPGTIVAVWRATGMARVVHTGIAGWPFPLGWFAVPSALLRARKLVIGVESSWRHGIPGQATWGTRFYDAVAERIARWACGRADACFYTQAAYRDALHRNARGPALINPAVWVNEDDVIDDATAAASWARKVAQPVRLLFAGRLTASKGIDVMLEAMRLLDDKQIEASLDVIGAGELRASCESAASALRRATITVLDPVAYGAPFLELVRGYHAVLVPSLGDEQPRIVFDAYAQAVPVIASDTNGLRPHVDHDKTGWLLPPGDSRVLAAAIEQATRRASHLHAMGIAALGATRSHTHRNMHRVRSQFLHRHLA
jgi:glycosyltransferase involved in cell wall biosynthesis